MGKRKWTDEFPTKQGFYWLWEDGFHEPELLFVQPFPDRPIKMVLADNHVRIVPNETKHNRFLGPVSVPKAPKKQIAQHD